MKNSRSFSRENIPGHEVCLLSHFAAVDSLYTSTLKILKDWSVLHCVLGPQHGFWGETQDNMIEWEGYTHPEYGIPVYSLYGKTRVPSEKMLDGADCVLVDLADVGSRYYTYIYSMAMTMRKCAELGIPVAIVDRPNPIGNKLIEGPVLDTRFSSFVGMYPMPVRHGLSIGELAVFFARCDGIPRPTVLQRDEPGAWIMPSPNMPTRDTALVYPGMCLLEAVNLSEGRGTTRPFEIFGAPWLDPWRLCDALNGSTFLRGAVLRPHFFIPTFNKHRGIKCGGAQIHVLDEALFRPFLAALGILDYCFTFPETRWNAPPYEYEYDKMPIDILAGGEHVRSAIESHCPDDLKALSYTPPEKWHPLEGVWERFVFS